MRRRIRISIAILAAMLSAGGRASAQDRPDYGSLVERVGSAFVTVKFVLKIQNQYGNSEREAEVTGVMIDPTGLVLCGNTRLGSARLKAIDW